jgi:hypothetical protein
MHDQARTFIARQAGGRSLRRAHRRDEQSEHDSECKAFHDPLGLSSIGIAFRNLSSSRPTTPMMRHHIARQPTGRNAEAAAAITVPD